MDSSTMVHTPVFRATMANKRSTLKVIAELEKRGVPIYQRLPNEPEKAWLMFEVYRDMPGRSVAKVSQALGLGRMPPGHMNVASSKYKWRIRAAAYDKAYGSTKARMIEEIVKPAAVAEAHEIVDWSVRASFTRLREYRLGLTLLDHVQTQLEYDAEAMAADAAANKPKSMADAEPGTEGSESPTDVQGKPVKITRKMRLDLKELAGTGKIAIGMMREASGLEDRKNTLAQVEMVEPEDATDDELRALLAAGKKQKPS